MKIKNEVEYKQLKNNNKSGSGRKLIRFMETWADIMEKGIKDGKKVEDIALDCSIIASASLTTKGVHITGVQMITSAQSLDKHWKFGGKVYESMRALMGMDNEENHQEHHHHVHDGSNVYESVKAVSANSKDNAGN